MISGVVVAAIAVAAILIGGYVLDILVLLFGGIGIFEFYNAFSKRGYAPIKLFGILYIVLLALMMYFDGDSYLSIMIEAKAFGRVNLFPPIFLLGMLILLALLVFRHEAYNAADAAITVFGGFYVLFLISYFVKLRDLEGGVYLFFLALIGAVATDTFAYFIGRAFGKRKLIEEISPNKTVAGVCRRLCRKHCRINDLRNRALVHGGVPRPAIVSLCNYRSHYRYCVTDRGSYGFCN